jgi:retron-type reverse transcriptase
VKRAGHLWERLTSFSNLIEAARRAALGKRNLHYVVRFEFNLERELSRLREDLLDRSYAPVGYRTFYIHDPKRRLISAAPFRDRVVHHALCQVIEPVFERGFIFHSYASRKGKGTHAAVERLQGFVRRFPWVFQCDVARFFPSIDHEILKAGIARRIKDPAVLWLAERIIDASNPQEPVCNWFPGDNLFTPVERPHGLPIGNQTSQFFANVYLDSFDHFVVEKLCAPAYIRYVDDFVILARDKSWLLDAREKCREFLGSLRLKMHPRKCVIFPAAEGTRFLGYRVFADYRLLPRSNVVGFLRRMRRLQRKYAAEEVEARDITRRVVAWIGHAAHADTFRLRRGILRGISFVRTPAR